MLIDFARIQAAKRQTDMAVDAAVRSALAAFDKELQGKYGLFGVSQEQVEPLFREMIEQNLTHPAGDGSFSLIDPQLSADSAQLEATGDLGNHVVFEQQVLEDMKYKAPIEITLEMFDKFKQLAAVMKTASAATKASKAMRKSYENREKNLESYWEDRKALEIADLAIPRLIEEALDEAKQKTESTNYETVGNAPNADGQTSENSDLDSEQASLEQLIKDMENLILPDSYFVRMEQDIQSEKAQLSAVQSSVDQLRSTLPTAYQSAQQPPSITTVKNQVQDIYDHHTAAGAQIHDHSTPSNYPEEAKRREEKEKYEQNKESPIVKQQEEQANLGIKDVFNILKAFKTLKAENEDYQKLDGYYQKYMQQQEADADKGQIEPSDDYEDASSQAMSTMDLLFAGLGDFFESMRNEMYVNEYAFEHFKSFNPGDSSNYFKDKKVDANELAKALGADNSGIEYLIYGLNKPGANIGAALGELFLIRVAIRTLEGFMDPKIKALGHPLLVVIVAIAYGVAKAVADMVGFFMNEDIPLAGFRPLDSIFLSYKDYLRLFLLIHSAESKKLARMQALIQLDTNKDLSQYSTYMFGKAQFSVRLWFLPEVMQSLSQTLFSNQEVKGNRYYYENGPKDMSY